MFKNKIILITGASRGIGAGILMAFAEQGAVVIGTATTEQGAEKIRHQLKEKNYSGTGIIVDVTSQTSIDQALENIRGQFGSVQILINNAGITRDNLFLRMKEEEWQQVIDANLSGVFRVTKACVRDMLKARGGKIISIGSVVGYTGNAGQVNYSATKAALMGFTKSLALEIGSRQITVNCVAPGLIATDMTDVISAEQKAQWAEKIPLGREGLVEDVAQAVLFLASEHANYITGQTLHVNGGLYMS